MSHWFRATLRPLLHGRPLELGNSHPSALRLFFPFNLPLCESLEAIYSAMNTTSCPPSLTDMQAQFLPSCPVVFKPPLSTSLAKWIAQDVVSTPKPTRSPASSPHTIISIVIATTQTSEVQHWVRNRVEGFSCLLPVKAKCGRTCQNMPDATLLIGNQNCSFPLVDEHKPASILTINVLWSHFFNVTTPTFKM